MSDYDEWEDNKKRMEDKDNSRDVIMLVIVFGGGSLILQLIKACS